MIGRATARAIAVAAVAVASLAGGCAHPQSLVEDRVLAEVASRYRDFFPAESDPDPARDAGLLRPRFGLPAIAPPRAQFLVELLERGADLPPPRAAIVRPDVAQEAAVRCVPDGAPFDGCYPLALEQVDKREVAPGFHRLRFIARTTLSPPDGGYDLVLQSGVDAPARAPRAVWVRARDPGAPLKVAHLSDLHVGKSDDPIDEHLAQVIADVETFAPDVVVISGDIAHRGGNPAQAAHARDLLLALHAPIVAVLGNHDLGFGVVPNLTTRYGDGWPNFARPFHPLLFFEVAIGRYRFVGFDSGPSTVTPRVLTRGISRETVDALREVADRARDDGVPVLFLVSHAPTRATMMESASPTSPGLVGQMHFGARELERVILDDAARGQRILHLTGHTHWTEVFESAPVDGKLQFVRWQPSRIGPCPTPVHGAAAIILAQSATRSGLTREGRGYGWDLLTVGDGDPRIFFRRFGAEPEAFACPQSTH